MKKQNVFKRQQRSSWRHPSSPPGGSNTDTEGEREVGGRGGHEEEATPQGSPHAGGPWPREQSSTFALRQSLCRSNTAVLLLPELNMTQHCATFQKIPNPERRNGHFFSYRFSPDESTEDRITSHNLQSDVLKIHFLNLFPQKFHSS